MRLQGKLVGLLARDLVLACEILGGESHVEVVVGIRVDERGFGRTTLPPIGIIDIVSSPPATMTSAPPSRSDPPRARSSADLTSNID
jgi:hypothetical protein